MSTTLKTHKSATVAGIISCLIWGGSIAVMGFLTQPLGAFTACGYECLIAGLVLVSISIRRRTFSQMFAHPLPYYFICGGFWLANFILVWIAVGLVTDSEQLVIVGAFNYLWPVFTLLCSIFILGNRAHFLVLPGLVVTLIGLFLSKAVLIDLPFVEATRRLSMLFDDNIPAYLCASLDALAWALYSNFSRRISRPGASGAVPLFMLIASLLSLLAGGVKGEVSHWSAVTLLVLVLWSLLSAIAYVAWDYGMRCGSVLVISIFSMFIPLLSTVITCQINNVPISFGLLTASGCIVGGAWLCKKGVTESQSG